MAYGGGIFVPSETAYKDPNRFRDVLQAEGNKEAQYLSQMDQFYAELEEMKREFDVTAEMKDRQFEETLAFNRDKLDWQSQENELDRSLQRWSVGQKVGVTREGLGIERDRLSLERDKFGEIQENNVFSRYITGRREDRTQDAFNTYDSLFDAFRSSQTPQLRTPSSPDSLATPIEPYSTGISGTSYSGFDSGDYDWNPSDWEDTLW